MAGDEADELAVMHRGGIRQGQWHLAGAYQLIDHASASSRLTTIEFTVYFTGTNLPIESLHRRRHKRLVDSQHD